MSLAGCQINPNDVNFYVQKSLGIFDTNSADKIQSQNYKGIKVPCLMPIRVKKSVQHHKNGCQISHRFYYLIWIPTPNYKIGLLFSMQYQKQIPLPLSNSLGTFTNSVITNLRIFSTKMNFVTNINSTHKDNNLFVTCFHEFQIYEIFSRKVYCFLLK